jgi:hypothetical protein
MLFDGEQHLPANRGEHPIVRPVRLRHGMMQRLMGRLPSYRLYSRCYWLDAHRQQLRRTPQSVTLCR